jgi:hypothetical protein
MTETTPSNAVAGGLLADELQTEMTGENAPVREERIANAVQFLVHPKVQASSMDERRRFLARKGLTGAGVFFWTRALLSPPHYTQLPKISNDGRADFLALQKLTKR